MRLAVVAWSAVKKNVDSCGARLSAFIAWRLSLALWWHLKRSFSLQRSWMDAKTFPWSNSIYAVCQFSEQDMCSSTWTFGVAGCRSFVFFCSTNFSIVTPYLFDRGLLAWITGFIRVLLFLIPLGALGCIIEICVSMWVKYITFERGTLLHLAQKTVYWGRTHRMGVFWG